MAAGLTSPVLRERLSAALLPSTVRQLQADWQEEDVTGGCLKKVCGSHPAGTYQARLVFYFTALYQTKIRALAGKYDVR